MLDISAPGCLYVDHFLLSHSFKFADMEACGDRGGVIRKALGRILLFLPLFLYLNKISF
jgi:hypothetical protein